MIFAMDVRTPVAIRERSSRFRSQAPPHANQGPFDKVITRDSQEQSNPYVNRETERTVTEVSGRRDGQFVPHVQAV